MFIQFLDDFFQFLEVVYLSVEELSHSLEVVPDLVQVDRVVKLCIVDPEHAIAQPMPLIDVLVAAGLASSKSEARRLIDGGGVKIDGEKATSYDTLVAPGSILQKGRHFARLVHA